MDFNLEKKQEIIKRNAERKITSINEKSTSPLRDYRVIYKQDIESPIKKDFGLCSLK